MQETFSRLIRSHCRETERRETIASTREIHRSSASAKIRENDRTEIPPSRMPRKKKKERTEISRICWKMRFALRWLKGRRSGRRQGSKDEGPVVQINYYDIIRVCEWHIYWWYCSRSRWWCRRPVGPKKRKRQTVEMRVGEGERRQERKEGLENSNSARDWLKLLPQTIHSARPVWPAHSRI